MKYLIVFFCIVVNVSLSAQNFKAEKFSPRLMNEISERGNDNLDVFIVLEAQIDLPALLDSFEIHQVSVQERAVLINKKLRAIAAHSQPAVFTELEKIGIRDYKPFWIVNSIYFKANVQQLQKLSYNDQIKYIDFNAELVIDEAEVVNAESGDRSNSRELGLEVIKAPEMWARGYTGYGTKAFIMDTGVDINHPALGRNYAGNAVPDEQAWFGFRDSNNRPYDCQNHGSHVTGTILGVDRENQDTIGVAFNAMWMGAPILLVCGGSTEIRMAGFQWALDPDDNPNTTEDMPDVINNSWTDSNVDLCYEVYTQLFTVLEAAGVAVVFAAGNDGPGVSTISAPKNINVSLVNTFAVAAINANNLNIANFSSRGPSACGGEGSLLIKPEVSAPGVSVRSSIPGNAYAEFNGTSMAAPHVAGAILLLKEAFPYLSGVEIKLALYFSAIDLGEPGEDNVFGMGLIDVDAAFNYLIQEGNVPIDPYVNIDLALINWDYNLDYCSGLFSFDLELLNQGQTVIDTVIVEFFTDEKSLVPFHTVEIADSLFIGSNTSLKLDLPALDEGQLQWMIRVNPKGYLDDRPLNNSIKIFVPYSQVEDWELNIKEDLIIGELCGGTNVLLQNQDSLYTLLWYSDSTNQTPLYIGNKFLYNLPEKDTLIELFAGQRRNASVFTEESLISEEFFIASEASGIVFKTIQDILLESFEIELSERGFFSIVLKNEKDEVKWSANKFFNQGVNKIIPNVHLNKDETYTLFLTGPKEIKLKSFNYSPDEIYEAFINFNGGLENNVFIENDFFIPFANIEFSFDVPCSLNKVPLNVKASGSNLESFFITENDFILENTEIQFTNETSGASLFEWDFGDGTISNEVSPTHSYDSPGVYYVSLTAIDLENCSDSYLKIINILEDTGVSTKSFTDEFNVHIYPNPAQKEINIDWDENIGVKSIELMTLNGRVILKNESHVLSSTFRLDLSNSPASSGIYILRLVLNDGSVVNRRIVII